ncbi:MAG: DUF433 domain-containing protein [Anaerolineales bacterium]|nr:DUF433 domain-containing protein [Anaerolineales bacterium]
MYELIEIKPGVCHGRPVFTGTRVLVGTILGVLAGGDSIEMILEDYPSLTREHIRVALVFASDLSLFEDVPYQVNQT